MTTTLGIALIIFALAVAYLPELYPFRFFLAVCYADAREFITLAPTKVRLWMSQMRHWWIGTKWYSRLITERVKDQRVGRPPSRYEWIALGELIRSHFFRHLCSFPKPGSAEWARYLQDSHAQAAFELNQWRDGKPAQLPPLYVAPWSEWHSLPYPVIHERWKAAVAIGNRLGYFSEHDATIR